MVEAATFCALRASRITRTSVCLRVLKLIVTGPTNSSSQAIDEFLMLGPDLPEAEQLRILEGEHVLKADRRLFPDPQCLLDGLNR